MGDKLGKSYSGQTFVPMQSAADVASYEAAQVPFAGEAAVPIEVWFSLRGHKGPVKHAAMKAYTKVRKATPEAWDLLFEGF